jgi:hypothetical protein
VDFGRVVCVDGPLAGAQVSFPAGERKCTLHDPVAGPVRYELTGSLSGPLPGNLQTARFLGPGE